MGDAAANWGEIVNGELGKPFVWGGRSDDAYDCWGLVLRVYRLLGWPNPGDWTSPEDGAAVTACVARVMEREFHGCDWVRVEHPRPGDVAALSTHTKLHHVGVVTPFGVLHTNRRHGVVVAKEAVLKAIGYRTVEYYRWVG